MRSWWMALAFAVLLLVLAFGDSINVPSILPSSKPIALPGFNVLVLTERSPGGPVESVTTSPEVRSWLRDNADQAYFWDDSHTSFDYVDQAWRDAFDKAIEDSNGERPWVLVSGSGGTSEKLPATAEGFVRLMERYK